MNFADFVDSAVNAAALRLMAQECPCTRTEVRARLIRGGNRQFVRQCLDCGEPVGGAVKQVGEVPEFDEDLKTFLREAREAERQEVRDAEREFWWAAYNRHLASAEWRAMRQRVLKRDNYLCQGCLDRNATEVHHLTYEHMGSEFAFELISLCGPCHERMHDHDTPTT